jgi:hypothetical protein
MTRRRRFLFLALPVVLVLLGVGAWVLWPKPQVTAITRDNAERIQPGMTLAEVEAILEGPARDETGGRCWTTYISSTLFVHAIDAQEWIGDECAVAVWFHDGRVAFRHLGDVVPRDERLVDKFRRWLRL